MMASMNAKIRLGRAGRAGRDSLLSLELGDDNSDFQHVYSVIGTYRGAEISSAP